MRPIRERRAFRYRTLVNQYADYVALKQRGQQDGWLSQAIHAVVRRGECIWWSSDYIAIPRARLEAALHDLGRAYSAMTPAQRVAAAVADGEALFPGYRDLVARPVSVAWANMPFQGGAWADWDEDGRRDAYPALLPPDGPYWFAGEHVSHLAGRQEGSIRATHHVLERIQARVAAGRTEARPG
ncbi:hypothetical protein [Microtetraspora malaysiensis]|uniref:hypothetical protein n=1 Tax=Microtetraspora malaysiensis TaxID=161358 RepID=UPI003D8A1F8B